MLSKILLTSAVIICAFFVLRQRHMQGEKQSLPSKLDSEIKEKETSTAKDELAADLRVGAYLFLILMVGLGAALYYFDWQDDHTILTIHLHRDNNSAPVSYEVYKYQLEERSFITTDGRSINVASNERMEVLGLED
ncbi:MAG: hypothetical protein OXU66_05450 [Gammaproteobacteria bacterium]|nr:hypothetical protein [Gammaproteobacteria bacterium]MDD9894965.1 hypothetical protein [Gammaproteobacteria bacterium]MDD9958369.1 hypothetical protein [Gammaproteobacteria bacterium]